MVARKIILPLCLCLAITIPLLAKASCLAEDQGSFQTQTMHFATTPPLSPGAVGFQLADLGLGAQELIEGGYQVGEGDQFYAPSISILFARERIGDLSYRTRAALPLLGEYLLSATPSAGNLFGASDPIVLVVTRAKDVPETRLRIVDGASWSSACHYSLPMSATAAAVAPDTSGGPWRLFLQDANSIHVYSLPDLTELRILTSAGGDGFALGQLDDDPAQEIIVAAAPGRIVDAVSGSIDWEYAPGFLQHVASGNFALNTYHGFVAAGYDGVHVFSATPYALAWTVPTPQFSFNGQQFAVADVNGDQRDDLLVAGEHTNGSQSIYSVRVFDTSTQQVLGEIAEPNYEEITWLDALPGRTAGSIEIVEALKNNGLLQSVRTRALEAPAQAWEEQLEVGPFTSFAVSDFLGGGTRQIMFTGSSSEKLPHVLDSISWLDVGAGNLSGTNGNAPLITKDLVALQSQASAASRVALGGSQFFGAIAALKVGDWSVDWQFGVANNPNIAPLGDHTVDKMLAYDFNGDGVDDVIAGASEYGGNTAGALVGVYDGSNGNQLWQSDPMGGYYAHLTDLQLAQGQPPQQDILLVAAASAVYAFSMNDGTQLWTIPQAATVLTSLDNGNVVVASDGGIVRAFDTNHAMIWEAGAGVPITAIAQPVAEGPILVASASRLRWLAPDTGAQLGVSRPIASSLARGNRWSLEVAADQRSLEMIAGSDAGMFDVNVALPANDEIFYDGSD